MLRRLPALAAACLALACAGARAQAAAPAVPALPAACAALAPGATDAATTGLRAQCVLAGLLPSTRRWEEARALGREAMRQGDATGALVVYLAFGTDPAHSALREGKPDLARYRELAARPPGQRQDQVEAIEALAFAAGRGHTQAIQLLAGYFHDTVAPHNVARVRETTGLLMRNGLRSELNDRLLREAMAIGDAAPQTKASVRGFLEAFRAAQAAARAAPGEASTAACERPTLRQVSAGDLRDPVFLPLSHPMVANTYLVRGEWDEFWLFDACGREVPLKLTFRADGWGGSTVTTAFNP